MHRPPPSRWWLSPPHARWAPPEPFASPRQLPDLVRNLVGGDDQRPRRPSPADPLGDAPTALDARSPAERASHPSQMTFGPIRMIAGRAPLGQHRGSAPYGEAVLMSVTQ